MERGKRICNALKGIRADIARQNDIPLEIPECTHEGDCPGTCPRCESEVRFLERELEKRRRQGKAVKVAGIAAGLTLILTSCTPKDEKKEDILAGDPVVTNDPSSDSSADQTPSDEPLAGDPVPPSEDYLLGEEPAGKKKPPSTRRNLSTLRTPRIQKPLKIRNNRPVPPPNCSPCPQLWDAVRTFRLHGLGVQNSQPTFLAFFAGRQFARLLVADTFGQTRRLRVKCADSGAGWVAKKQGNREGYPAF